MAATVDFTPISTIVLYLWVFVDVLFKAMTLENELPGLTRMVAEFIDVKTCVHYLIMMILVNHGTTTMEKIRYWHIYSKRVKDDYMQGNYNYKSYAYFDLSKICKSSAFNAATHDVVANSMSEKCKTLTWTDKSSQPDTTKEVIDNSKLLKSKGKDNSIGNDTMKDEVKAIEYSDSDESIIIPVDNVDYNKNVDLKNEQNGQKRKRVKTRRICTRRKIITCEENKQSTKAKVSCTFEFDFTAGALLAVKPSKKAFMLAFLILSGLAPTAAAPIQQDPERRGLYEYRLLVTSNCNYRDLIVSRTCQTDEELAQTYIDYCGFADLCNPGFKPVCVSGDDGGMFHICSPEGLTCPKGYRRRAWLNSTDSDVVLVEEVKCPEGKYQSEKSICYDACENRYEDIKDLPAKYAIFSEGNNISPPWIYCDFEKGFYNMDGKFLLEYGEEFKYFPYFCTSVSDVNICATGKYPLPNGTCVLPCKEGLKRDVHDGFLCKVQSQNWADNLPGKEENSIEKEHRQETSRSITEYKGPIEIDMTTQSPGVRTNDADDHEKTTSSAILIAGLVTGFFISLTLAVAFGVLFWAYRTKHKAKSIRIKNESRTENRTIIDKVDNVHITHHVTTGENGTRDAQPFLGGDSQE
ncbi:uncharacterized protein LOC123538679 isoform X2 [Mercenaria mercenaria]|uniref:uncharacterized protein LOC123538679 isoform X2 n=1 Tax=Mercenaria mercenaria TaxID=6596 RepID=UPI00234E9565|nr:uncharacterized protein LOC123538679 isoform X2 [Mercenaria mercenaria]